MEREYKDEIKEIKMVCANTSQMNDIILRLILEIVFQQGAKEGLNEARQIG